MGDSSIYFDDVIGDPIGWTRRALAVLTAAGVDADLAQQVFVEMVAPTDEYSEHEAALALATGMGNVAQILLGQLMIERDISRSEVCEFVSAVITDVEVNLD